MLTRFLSVVLVCVGSSLVQAQLPSSRFSPLNYFGRNQGFGYSDGYHACKDRKGEDRKNRESGWSSWSLAKPTWSMSNFYGAPTSPDGSSININAPSFSPAYSENDFQYQAFPQSEPIPSVEQRLPPQTKPQYAPGPYESVPPAPPVQPQPSSSDREPEPIYSPRAEVTQPPPLAFQSKRVPPGNRSLLHPSIYRK